MTNFTQLLSLIEKEIVYEFVRSSGPGGQNVNKVATAVQLHFDIGNSSYLPGDVKKHLMSFSDKRITREGVLIIEAKRHRTQEQNRIDAKERFIVLLQKAMTRQKKRQPTKSTITSQIRRVRVKIQHGNTKRLRRIVKNED
jgi:ribosome-associated protein